MSERITTAEELDALPVGSVMRTRAGQLCETGVIGPTDPQRVVWCDGWSDHAAAIEYFAPLTVLHRPDAPVTAGATVTREQVANLVETALGLIGEAWDDGNATGLDGWTGPGRGSGEIDWEAQHARTRMVHKADGALTALGLTVVDGADRGGEA